MDNTVAIVGLGYVGLPLAMAFGRAGLPVIGIEMNLSKVDQLNAGHSYIPDVSDAEIASLAGQGHFHATDNYDEAGKADAIFICVPTPYDAAKAPDLSFIISATNISRP